MEACRQVDTTLFYSPEESGAAQGAPRGCGQAGLRDVQARELCAAAIATWEPYGTWGGLSENDRREHVRRSDPRADPAPLPHGAGRLGDRRIRRSQSGPSAVGRLQAVRAGPRPSGGWPPAGRRDRPWPRCRADVGHPGPELLALVPGLDPVDGGGQDLGLVPSGTPTSWNRSPSGVWRTRMSPGLAALTEECSRACEAGGPRAWSRTSPGPG